jgi:hypothetical protein
MLFDEVAEEIRVIVRHTGLEQTLAIGRLVLDRFFDGSVASWRERRNHKNNSVRRLAKSPGCPLSRSALNQAIGIYAVTVAVPSVLTLRHIEASHIAVVLPLRAAEQERWLFEAQTRRWSVRQLRDAVRAERRDQGERRGRPRATAQRRALTATRSSLERLESSLDALAGVELGAADQVALADLASRIAAVRVQLGEVGSRPLPEARESGTWRTVLKVDAPPPPEDEDKTTVAS